MDPIKIIKYKKQDNTWHFKVAVGTPADQTLHRVTLAESYWRKLTDGKRGADQLVLDSFRFLLTKEPKESILASFDLPVIQTYFPDYEEEMMHS